MSAKKMIKTNNIVKDSTLTDRFSLSFEGENEIEASVLGNTLSNLAYVVSQIVEDEPLKPEYSLKIKSFRKGSFRVDFIFTLLSLGAATQMAGISSLEQAANLFTIITGIFDIKAKLKGEKPKEVKENLSEGLVQVVAPDGTEVIAPLGSNIVIRNPSVDRKMSEIAQNVRLHNPNGGIKLIRGEEQYLYDKDSIDDIAETTQITTMKNTATSHEERVALPIKKPDLLGNGSWDFRYGNRTIRASINDVEFLKQVHDGKTAYKAGDKLDVSLLTDIKLSPDNTPISETYTIEKVHGIVLAPEQTHM